MPLEVAAARCSSWTTTPTFSCYLTAAAGGHGLRTVTARTAAEGLQAAAARAAPDAITLDISMPGRSGIEVLHQLAVHSRSSPGSPVIVVTGAIEFRELIYHRNVPPPDGYVEKPVKPDLLLMSVRKVLEHRHRAAAAGGRPGAQGGRRPMSDLLDEGIAGDLPHPSSRRRPVT